MFSATTDFVCVCSASCQFYFLIFKDLSALFLSLSLVFALVQTHTHTHTDIHAHMRTHTHTHRYPHIHTHGVSDMDLYKLFNRGCRFTEAESIQTFKNIATTEEACFEPNQKSQIIQKMICDPFSAFSTDGEGCKLHKLC